MAQEERRTIRNMTLFQALIAQGCAIEAAVRIANDQDDVTQAKAARLPPYEEPRPSASLFPWG